MRCPNSHVNAQSDLTERLAGRRGVLLTSKTGPRNQSEDRFLGDLTLNSPRQASIIPRKLTGGLFRIIEPTSDQHSF
jgi:hypothetical protein